MDVLWCLLAAFTGGVGGWWWCRRIWRRRWATARDGEAREAFAADLHLADLVKALGQLAQVKADALAVAVAAAVVDQAWRDYVKESGR